MEKGRQGFWKGKQKITNPFIKSILIITSNLLQFVRALEKDIVSNLHFPY